MNGLDNVLTMCLSVASGRASSHPPLASHGSLSAGD
jgi:hypothetical protein